MTGSIRLLLLLGVGLALLCMFLTWLILRLRHASAEIRASAWRYCWIVLPFLGLDWIWVLALPRLGISFGPPEAALMFFNGLRLGFWFIWVLILALLSGRRLANHPARMLRFRRRSERWLFALNLALLCVGLYGFYIDPQNLTVTTIQLAAPQVHLQHPLRIVQLSDLHVERTTQRELALAPLVNGLNPDLIVLTGDYLNLSYRTDPIAERDLHTLIGKLHARLGIYAVNGSLETPPHMRRMFEGLNVHILDNQAERLDVGGGQVYLVGVTDVTEIDNRSIQQVMKQVPPGEFSLLLYHCPDTAPSASQAGVSLFLTGHTHGGQVRLPLYGALVTSSIFGKRFEHGYYQVGNMSMYVSAGIGLEGAAAPRVRFLDTPEVVVVDLQLGEQP